MKQYRSHEVVTAGIITAVNESDLTVTVGETIFDVNQNWWSRNVPMVGEWYVAGSEYVRVLSSARFDHKFTEINKVSAPPVEQTPRFPFSRVLLGLTQRRKYAREGWSPGRYVTREAGKVVDENGADWVPNNTRALLTKDWYEVGEDGL